MLLLFRHCQFQIHPRHARQYSPKSGSVEGKGVLLDNLRSLLRQSAQPVTVITIGSPTSSSSPSPNGLSDSTSSYHGATLSSFSSIAFFPYPVIAFSLRLPSRMASRLIRPHPHPHTPSELTSITGGKRIEFAINILSEHQANLAKTFSRPDLFPHPFESIPYTLSQTKDSERGIPLLDNCLGSLICEVLESFRLDKWSSDSGSNSDSHETCTNGSNGWMSGASSCLSHLFLARVGEVLPNPDGKGLLPLIYHNGGYTTTKTDEPRSPLPPPFNLPNTAFSNKQTS